MTTQEFVDTTAYEVSEFRFKGLLIDDKSLILAKQEYSNGIITGLTKGLEIAKEFAEWMLDEERYDRTTSELLTIFLTEKYWNNG